MTHPWRRIFLVVVFVVVVANYIAQVPYYLRLYYFPHHTPPALWGSLALAATLAWFLAGWALLWRGRSVGYGLTLSFLVVETGFYLYNEVNQVAHGFPPFFHLANPDPVLWTVFAIGYLNMVAGIVFIAMLLASRRALLAPAATHRAAPPLSIQQAAVAAPASGSRRAWGQDWGQRRDRA
ncbi:MAG TPA: hypothetical protein VFQ25_02245 [Ktedonobacterales bacterium]|nr:hypothetical protein [Ktedonobacterales bacterium]